MAVTFGNFGSNGSQGTTSFSFNNNGDFMLLCMNETDNNVTSVTFNGVAMTRIGTAQFVGGVINRYHHLFGLVNPAAGSNTVVVTGGANQNIGIQAISGYGSNDGFNYTSWTSGSANTLSMNTSIANAYVVGFTTAVTFGSFGSGITNIGTINGDGNMRLFRTTNAVASPTSVSVGINTGGSNDGMGMAVCINPVTTVAYTMDAAVGAFTLTGIAAALIYGKIIAADLGTFVLTGTDTMFKIAITMAADVGTFVLTSIDTGLVYGKIMAADVGTFVLTGVDATFNFGRNLAADVGEFVLTGIDNVLSYGRHMTAATGVFVLTGIPAIFPIFWRNAVKTSVSVVNSVKTALGSWINLDKTNSV